MARPRRDFGSNRFGLAEDLQLILLFVKLISTLKQFVCQNLPYPKIVGNAAAPPPPPPPPPRTTTRSPKPEGHRFLWFCRSDLSDPMARQVLHLLQPLDTDDDSGGSSDDDEIEIVAGTLLSDDSAVYHVRRVLTNEKHFAVMVI
jgi:hypothetical protein